MSTSRVLISLIFVQVYFTCSYCFGINDNEVLNLYKQTYQGDGTYYGFTESGLCALDIPNLPPVAPYVDRLVALNAPQMFGSSTCGICLKVNATGEGLGLTPITGSFIVYVKDLCPECRPGDVDFAEEGDGRWKISMQAVQCPVKGSIEYVLQGSNKYYIKLQIRNDRMPTTTLLMYQPVNNKWTQMARTLDGFWEFPKNDNTIDKPIRNPLRLLLYAPTGQVLFDEISPPSMNFSGIIHGNGVQYKVEPNIPSA